MKPWNLTIIHCYMRVYNYYKQLILSQQLLHLKAGCRRSGGAAELQMSRTTVETVTWCLRQRAILFPGRRADFM